MYVKHDGKPKIYLVVKLKLNLVAKSNGSI